MAMTIATVPVGTSGGAAQFPPAQQNNGNADLANLHQVGVQRISEWKYEGLEDQTKANRIRNLDYYPRAPEESCMTFKTKRIISIILIIVGIAAMVIGTGLLAGFGFAAFVAAAGTAVTIITTLALIALGMCGAIFGHKMYKGSRTTEQANDDFVDDQIAARQREVYDREPEEMDREQLDVDDDADKDELYEEGVLKGQLKPDERWPSYFRTEQALNKVLPIMKKKVQGLQIEEVD